VSRTIWIPDFGASDSLYQPLQIPEPGEPGYLSPAERYAFADPGDRVQQVIAREQAIEEALELQALRAEAAQAEAELEAGL
jgi:hypothetical protein